MFNFFSKEDTASCKKAYSSSGQATSYISVSLLSFKLISLLVYIQENGDLPDGSKLVHPEITAIIEDNKIAMFSTIRKRARIYF